MTTGAEQLEPPQQPEQPNGAATTLTAQQVHEHERLLQQVYGIEQRIGVLLKVAAQTIEQTTSEALTEHALQALQKSTVTYVEILMEIQAGLRVIIRELVQSNILTMAGTSLPYRGSLASLEKQHEIANSVHAMAQRRVAAIMRQIETVTADQS
ncbi:hypothetical protein CXG81DRAFT_25065 [Caulochytrium protostelioides]|uniref:Mediator of RNA polymerase II transcription subunit 11 n=1 Tax=Caulochytrium protostelioides TaxID=1555241 RepID=A0A4P9XAD6_9FUNG|nr:hypothetical protein CAUPRSCDRAFT_11172 [Caulochytrium protostelioides]RKP02285.1 hypothetical protein CXG81DRAFT_25065 [Caulochytrium protostelioides]|eukprot:RKP02285.1 hypothetical protein CXG81DRAFT_25065 [Caulochytrium protostelioides]